MARPCPKHKDYEDVLRRHITKFSDTTLEEIQGLTCREHAVKVRLGLPLERAESNEAVT